MTKGQLLFKNEYPVFKGKPPQNRRIELAFVKEHELTSIYRELKDNVEKPLREFAERGRASTDVTLIESIRKLDDMAGKALLMAAYTKQHNLSEIHGAVRKKILNSIPKRLKAEMHLHVPSSQWIITIHVNGSKKEVAYLTSTLEDKQPLAISLRTEHSKKKFMLKYRDIDDVIPSIVFMQSIVAREALRISKVAKA